MPPVTLHSVSCPTGRNADCGILVLRQFFQLSSNLDVSYGTLRDEADAMMQANLPEGISLSELKEMIGEQMSHELFEFLLQKHLPMTKIEIYEIVQTLGKGRAGLDVHVRILNATGQPAQNPVTKKTWRLALKRGQNESGPTAGHYTLLEAAKYLTAPDHIRGELLLGEYGEETMQIAGRQCERCSQPAKSECSKCEKVSYCSRECQQQDWMTHKRICCQYGMMIVEVTVALKCPHLQKLVEMVPSLLAQLPPGKFTLFAPTNKALKKWGGSLSGDALSKFLAHHIVMEPLTMNELKKRPSVTPKFGQPIAVDETGALGTDFSAHIVETVECEGSVIIHKIDHPLLSEYIGNVGDIEQMTLENTHYRRVLDTSERSQIVLMSLVPGAWVERESHPTMSQFVRFERGLGKVDIAGTKDEVSDGDFVLVPENTFHAIFNMGKDRLQLYTVYSFNKGALLPHPVDAIEDIQVMAPKD